MAYDRITLRNGLRIIGEHMDAVHTVAVGLFVRTGAVNEIPAENGYSHFVEHMVFKGTRDRDAAALADEMDRLGGATNAFTTKESTCFYTKVLKEDLGRGIRLLQDLILRPDFPEEDLEREKGVVIEEIAMCEDNPEDLVHELLSDAQYQGHPLGLPILGTEEIIRGITREKLFRFLHTHYTPENTVVSIAGAYDWEEAVALLESAFGSWPSGGAAVRSMPPAPALQNHLVRVKDVEQVQICVGYPAFAGNAPESYAQLILSTLFGGSMSSRLFQSIRERNGLAYSVYSYVNVYSGVGEMELYAGTSPETAQQVADLMGAEVKKLLREGVSQDEFEKARQSARISFVMGQESNTSRMRGNGNVLLLYNTTRSFEEILDKLEKTTCADVNDVAQRIFSAPFCTAVVGRAGEPISFAAF
ncbi:MAG: M16 family metallopeptidase [Candidatus Spyradocola sp.]|jgi:predicted Zn-dependent peptidase